MMIGEYVCTCEVIGQWGVYMQGDWSMVSTCKVIAQWGLYASWLVNGCH